MARSIHQRKLQVLRVEVQVLGDREILEKGEARVLANNFKDKELLQSALRISERIYGKGSGERIRAHMRVIWKEELLK